MSRSTSKEEIASGKQSGSTGSILKARAEGNGHACGPISDYGAVSEELQERGEPVDDDLMIPPLLDRRLGCAQCTGQPDGTERLVMIEGQTVWLHRECERFYRPEGWCLDQSSPTSVVRSSL